MRELVARVRVLLRRVERARDLAARAPAAIVVGSLRIDPLGGACTATGSTST